MHHCWQHAKTIIQHTLLRYSGDTCRIHYLLSSTHSPPLLSKLRRSGGGVFAQRVHSARTAPNITPIITLFIPGTILKTTPLQKRA